MFARQHESLGEFWNTCPRADWMLWILEWAVGFGVVTRPEVNLERFKVAPVAGVHRLAEWLTAQHIQAQALRKALPAPFTNINRAWFNTRRQEVDFSVQPGATPIEERLAVKFKKEKPAERTTPLELDAPVQPQPTKESSPMPNTTTTTPVATPAPTSTSNGFALTGLILGILSVFLYIVGIVPVLAVVFSGMGLSKVKEGGGKGKVQAWVGLVLGALYTLVMMNYYGHLR